MTIKGFHNHTLTRTIQISSLLSLPISIYLLVVYFTWWYLFCTILSIILIGKLGHSAGQHRYFCHGSFKTDRMRETILGLLCTLCTTHSPIYYAAVHRFHHMNSDTELDPHSPRRQGFIKSFLGFVDQKSVDSIPKKIIKDLIKNPTVMFFHNWYWIIIFSYCLLCTVVDFKLLFFCYLIPVGYTQFVNSTQIFFGHKWGYKNFNLSDDSTNNIFWNIITLGEGLHNNHHNDSYQYNFSYTNEFMEFDPTGFLIKHLLAK